METITDLIKGVSVPRMVKIREVFDDTHIPVNMIADMVNAELSREALGGQVKPGMLAFANYHVACRGMRLTMQ